jgi:RHS repeat-associated protein
MRYTTDGITTPTETVGTLIDGSSGSVTVPVNSYWIISVIAFKAGMADSDISSGTYDTTDNGGQSPVFGQPGGMDDPMTWGNPQRTVDYTLDKVGNRTNVNENGVDTPYTPDNINRYTQVGTDSVTTGPEHQIGGYQTGGQATSYYYVGDTYLAKITQGSNTYTLWYDALGRCVKRTLNNATTYYVYDGDKAIIETGPTNAYNIYGAGIDEIVARYESGTTAYYFAQDHEGSVTHVFDSNGTLVEQYRYDAFGAPTIRDGSGNVISTSAINNRFMFTGREYVATFGIYEYRNRAYHPGLGRFMSEDPKGFDAGDYNLFRYVDNDPLDRTDPTGAYAVADDLALAGAGALVGVGLQAIQDLAAGQLSGWQDYTGAFIGGAIGGVSVEYVPPLAPAIGAASTNSITQGLKMASGAQHGFNKKQLAEETAVGALFGRLHLRIRGVNFGRNNFTAITKSMITKLRNGTIKRVSIKTAAKATTAAAVHESGETVEAAAKGVERRIERSHAREQTTEQSHANTPPPSTQQPPAPPSVFVPPWPSYPYKP